MIVSCPECGTRTEVEPEDATTVIEAHNERAHDGEQVAGVGEDALPLPDFTEEQKESMADTVEMLNEMVSGEGNR